MSKKAKNTNSKSKLHPRNKHRSRYDFKVLREKCPELVEFIHTNEYGDESINFFDSKAVKMLNKALLQRYYGIKNWDIPEGYLCPPIPGRADYIHYVADLLATTNKGKIPIGAKIKCLDIGVGSSCIYPIIGQHEYNWSFVGADIEINSLENVQSILSSNPQLQGKIELRLQKNQNHIFEGIIQKGEQFHVSICNPPFHSSQEEAEKGNLRKLKNLKQQKVKKSRLNFGGKSNELWCEGGEETFIKNMIDQSRLVKNQCYWFTTLVSKESTLKSIYKNFKKANINNYQTIPMGQGNKKSRIVAWTFMRTNNHT